NEDFAVESLAGDIFQLGNNSYRIVRVEAGRVRVADAHGLPPSIPFWLGEAPGRSDELSHAVSRLRGEIASRLGDTNVEAWLIEELGLPQAAAAQLKDYLAAAQAALGVLPTQTHVVFERFFDASGGMQLLIHAPLGSRINRAWGLALRKRFCRKFNFELQAAATEDTIVLSLGGSHSFELAEVAHYLASSSVRQLLTQALLDAPMFNTRWRWNATVALALPRFRGGKRIATQLQRMNAEDLIAAVFPDQLACAENIAGEREIPQHPLVNQTVYDCLHEAMDIGGLERLLRRLEDGTLRVTACDLTEPSPLALEILSARPYAFLDDAPLEERRTQAVMSRRWIDPNSAADIGKLDPEAIEKVRVEAWPDARDADELHDALLCLGFLAQGELQQDWRAHLDTLALQRRATRLPIGGGVWVAAERLQQWRAVYRGTRPHPAIETPQPFASQLWERSEALREIVRGRLQGLGPVTAVALASSMGVVPTEIEAALGALEAEGFVLRGRFTPAGSETEWCERRLLARIHRYTVQRLRSEVEPVSAAEFMRFLFQWQHLGPETQLRGQDAVTAVVAQLEGFEAPAVAWEGDLLPARIGDYQPEWLDGLCQAGRMVWARVSPCASGNGAAPRVGPVRTSPIVLLGRRHAGLWSLFNTQSTRTFRLGNPAHCVAEYLERRGASFFDEITQGTGLLRSQVEQALGELVAAGLANADSYGGLRALLVPVERRRPFAAANRQSRSALFGIEDAGRWALFGRKSAKTEPIGVAGSPNAERDAAVEHVARALLRRYGVVFRSLLQREASWMPAWRELRVVLHRLEARGEIRGGRFVAGVSGEHYALPEAVGLLREVRRTPAAGSLISVCAADPLNLSGSVVEGPKIPTLAKNRVAYRDGVPVAAWLGGEFTAFANLAEQHRQQARQVLLTRNPPARLKACLI
ncbi:MAG: Lhr family helicase, partial [Burkholderiales bacterium]